MTKGEPWVQVLGTLVIFLALATSGAEEGRGLGRPARGEIFPLGFFFETRWMRRLVASKSPGSAIEEGLPRMMLLQPSRLRSSGFDFFTVSAGESGAAAPAFHDLDLQPAQRVGGIESGSQR